MWKLNAILNGGSQIIYQVHQDNQNNLRISGCNIDEVYIHYVECPDNQTYITKLNGTVIAFTYISIEYKWEQVYIALVTDDMPNVIQHYNL